MEVGFQDNALSYVLVPRLILFVPFFIVNLVPAFLGVPWRTYVLGTFIGIIPVTYVYESVGTGLDRLFAAGGEFGAQNILTPHILMALIGFSCPAMLVGRAAEVASLKALTTT